MSAQPKDASVIQKAASLLGGGGSGNETLAELKAGEILVHVIFSSSNKYSS